MDYKELRYGNAITHSITKRTIVVDAEVFSAMGRGFGKHYRLIPITAATLTRLGYSRDRQQPNCFRRDTGLKEPDVSAKEYLFIEQVFNEDLPYKFLFYVCCFSGGHDGSYSVELRSVHQLQNLHFALTGEELIYEH